jgi:CheY-like chemotaxis protein/anti-sigma regulatory factor (Ser/Thr protein kinase)
MTTGARVLVVEDMPSMRAHVVETLRDLGQDVHIDACEDGQAALDRIAREPPYQLIVSDIIMPRIDGARLLAELRERQYPAAVVMLSALGEDDTIISCLRQGACDYLIKPVRIDDIVLAASNALQHMPLITDRMEIAYDPHGWFEVSGESDPAILYRYRRFLGLLERFRIPEPAASEVRLTLEELGRNAIEWGNANDRSKSVRFGCRILPGKVIVTIEDEGSGFRTDAVPDPSRDPIAHIEHRKASGKRLGGYGIHLIRNLMDKVVYNAKGNRVVAIKYLTPAPQSVSA